MSKKAFSIFLLLANILIIGGFVLFLTDWHLVIFNSVKNFDLGILTSNSSQIQNTENLNQSADIFESKSAKINVPLVVKNFDLSKKQKNILKSVEDARVKLLVYHRDLRPWKDGTAIYSSGKALEVDLTHQKFYVWENGKIIRDWLTSTGKPETPTKSGVFSILSKVEVAYGHDPKTKKLWVMRKFQGVYYAGSIENGIHSVMTGGDAYSLGTVQSHGCIRVSYSNAVWLYTWTNIGTPVVIHY